MEFKWFSIKPVLQSYLTGGTIGGSSAVSLRVKGTRASASEPRVKIGHEQSCLHKVTNNPIALQTR